MKTKDYLNGYRDELREENYGRAPGSYVPGGFGPGPGTAKWQYTHTPEAESWFRIHYSYQGKNYITFIEADTAREAVDYVKQYGVLHKDEDQLESNMISNIRAGSKLNQAGLERHIYPWR